MSTISSTSSNIKFIQESLYCNNTSNQIQEIEKVSPLTKLISHLIDPVENVIITNLAIIATCITIILLVISTLIKNFFIVKKPDKKIQLSEIELKKKNYLKIMKEREKEFPLDFKIKFNQKLTSLGMENTDTIKAFKYLDFILSIPYKRLSKDIYDFKKAEKILENLHGMKHEKEVFLNLIFDLLKVEEEIIEKEKKKEKEKIIDNSNSNYFQRYKNKILFIYGQEGTGKKTLGKCLAQALDRKVYIVNYLQNQNLEGNSSDPGIISEAFKETGVTNPVIIIQNFNTKSNKDNAKEINFLNDMLDQKKRKKYFDKYLEVNLDISKVFFVLCCKDINSDMKMFLCERTYFLRTLPHSLASKKEIFLKSFNPIEIESNKINVQIKFTESGIKSLINNYSRSPGLKVLKLNTELLYAKIKYELGNKLVNDKSEDYKETKVKELIIDEYTIKTYLGKYKYQFKKIYENTPIGVSIGMTVSDNKEGTINYVESVKYSTSESTNGISDFKISGNLLTTCKESVEVAYSFAQMFYNKYKELKINDSKEFVFKNIHIGFSDYYIPKDGPSAGVAFVSSLLSLAFGIPIKRNIAITGTISLLGRISTIGKVSTKVIGAIEEGILEFIIPSLNKEDIDEFSDQIPSDTKLHFVDDYEEVFKILFSEHLK